MRAPLEECEAAGAIKTVGGRAVIIDGPGEGLTDSEFIARVTHSAPEALILVVTFGTLYADLLWATKFRGLFPELLIGVRGAPCYTSETEIFSTSQAIDFLVKGEYESIFQALCIQGIAGVPGVSFRESEVVVTSPTGPLAADLDALPLPDRSSLNFFRYSVRGFRDPQATVRVQRGCPFPCSYCLVHVVSGNSARHRSPRHIATEVSQLMKEGITSFYFRADTFTLDREWVVLLCKTLQKDCPGIRWVTTTRADKVDEELISIMGAAGCYGISFGIDVASHTIGKKVHKLANLEVTKQALKACDSAGIISLVYIMVGFIWETSETLKESRQFLSRITPDLLTIHYAHPYPGTNYYNEVHASGSEVLSLRAQAEPATTCNGISIKELQRSAKMMLIRHYLRPKVLFSLTKKVVRLMVIRGSSRNLSRSPTV